MPQPLDSLLPHRAPMLWIEALLEVDDKTASATASFTEADFPVENGRVLESALVECVAQTVAAAAGHLASMAEQSGTAPAGMLAAVSSFRIHSSPRAGQRLHIEVRERKRFGRMRLVAGQVRCDGEVIASGELTLYA